MSYWLLKEEPTKYSYRDLVDDGKTVWGGVKNPLALKHLRSFKKGDRALYYETGKVKAAVGIVEITRAPWPDPAKKDPRLVVVEVRPVKPLPSPVTLAAIKGSPLFRDHPLVRIPRLSVMPLSAAQWKGVLALARSGGE